MTQRSQTSELANVSIGRKRGSHDSSSTDDSTDDEREKKRAKSMKIETKWMLSNTQSDNDSSSTDDATDEPVVKKKKTESMKEVTEWMKKLPIDQSETTTDSIDYTVVFCGLTGVGKNSAGNFFLGKSLFPVNDGTSRHTIRSHAEVCTVLNKRIQIVSTPGFFDDYSCPEETLKELSYVFTYARNGIHAVAFVMNIKERFTTKLINAIEQLLELKGIQPFVFFLFTHASERGIYKSEAVHYIKQIKSKKKCPPRFKDLVTIVDYRVMMVESCDHVSSEVNYKELKCKELLTMIERISQSGKVNYSPTLFQLTAKLYEQEKHKQEAKTKETLMMFESIKAKLHEQNTTGVLVPSNDVRGELKDKKAIENTRIALQNAMFTQKHFLIAGGILTFLHRTSITIKSTIARIGGFAVGAAIGTAIFPVVGTTIGGALGYVGGKMLDNAIENKDDCKQQ